MFGVKTLGLQHGLGGLGCATRGQCLGLRAQVEQSDAVVFACQRQGGCIVLHPDEIDGHALGSLMQQLEIRVLAVDAWATILRDHGKFGLDRLLQPAIQAAEEGYAVAPRIACTAAFMSSAR